MAWGRQVCKILSTCQDTDFEAESLQSTPSLQQSNSPSIKPAVFTSCGERCIQSPVHSSLPSFCTTLIIYEQFSHQTRITTNERISPAFHQDGPCNIQLLHDSSSGSVTALWPYKLLGDILHNVSGIISRISFVTTDIALLWINSWK